MGLYMSNNKISNKSWVGVSPEDLRFVMITARFIRTVCMCRIR